MASPMRSKSEESPLKYLHLARILIRYRKRLAEVMEGTLFIEKLMQVLDADECQYIQDIVFHKGKVLAGILIVIRHLELGSPKEYNIFLQILETAAPKTAKILAGSTYKAWEFTTHDAISTLDDLSFALVIQLSIKDISSDLKGLLSVSELSEILAHETREAQVSAFCSLLNSELQSGHMLLWEIFLITLEQTNPDIHEQIQELLKGKTSERSDSCEFLNQGRSEEFNRYAYNTEKCRTCTSKSEIFSILETEKYERKYGIIYGLEPDPYLALIDCVIKELKSGSFELYHEFLSAMLEIDVFFLSQTIDRCDFASLTLKKNLVHLVKELDITCVIQAIGSSLNEDEKDIIDSKIQTLEKTSSLSELIQLRLSGKRHDLFDRFLEILAGIDPKTFSLLAGRVPTAQEAESCIKAEISELKKCIKEVGHKTDKKRDVRIDLEKNYVKLRVAEKNQNIDHPITYQATLTKCDLDIEDVMARYETKGKLCLIKGHCGIGKTTMAQHLCRRWATNEGLKEFLVLFHINVRQINLFYKQLSLHALLTKNSLYQNRVPLKWLKHWSHLVLINIDGLDELGCFSDKMHSTQEIRDICEEATPEEILVNILKRNLLSEATLICTSRPFETLSSLESDVDLEVMGLTQEGILEFIDKNVPFEGQMRVKSHLKANPILMSVCSITVYISILSRILGREHKLSADDIDTYSRLTATLVRSYPLRESGEYVQQSQCSKSFPALAEIALYADNSEEDNGLTKISFDLEEDICQVKTVDAEKAIKNAEKNGLVHITEIQMDDKNKKILEFPHLSVQEFFAALQFLKMSNMPQNYVEEKLRKLLEIGTLNMYPRFIYGLAMDRVSKNIKHMKKFTIGSAEVDDGIIESITKCFDTLVTKSMSSHQLLNVCQIAYEAQNKQLAKTIIEKCQIIQSSLDIDGTPLNALDIMALVFVTGSSNLQQVNLTKTNLDCYSVGILVQCLKGNKQLKALDLSYNQIKEDGLSAISQLLVEITGLEKLSLNRNSITSSSLKMLLPGLKKERQTIALSIAENDIGDEGAMALASALMNTKVLTALNVRHNNIRLKGMQALKTLDKMSSFL